MVGQARLELALSERTGFTVRCGTNYALLTHMARILRIILEHPCFGSLPRKIRKFPLRFLVEPAGFDPARAGLQPAALPTELRFHLAEVEGLELSSGCPRRFSGPVRYQLRYTSVFGVDDGI